MCKNHLLKLHETFCTWKSTITRVENDAPNNLTVPCFDPEKLKWKLCKEIYVGKKSFAAILHDFMGHEKCSSINSFSSILSQFHRERRSFPWPLVRNNPWIYLKNYLKNWWHYKMQLNWETISNTLRRRYVLSICVRKLTIPYTNIHQLSHTMID